jgi:hypothetical protein
MVEGKTWIHWKIVKCDNNLGLLVVCVSPFPIHNFRITLPRHKFVFLFGLSDEHVKSTNVALSLQTFHIMEGSSHNWGTPKGLPHAKDCNSQN